MKNKQTLILVLSFAAVTSVVTLFAQSGTRMFRTSSSMPHLLENYAGEDAYIGDEATGTFVNEDLDGSNKLQVAETRMAIEPAMGIMPYPSYGGDDVLDVEDRVYQKSSNHSVVVKDVPVYLRGMKEYILSIDGKILNSSVYSVTKYAAGSLYIKVPVEKFDEVTARSTEGVEKIVNENISASDVTGQLVNTTESVQSLKDQKSLKEAQLKDAKTEVEKRRYKIEIERIERQIVSAEKSVDRVEQKVEYASVSITAADSERYYNPEADGTIGEEFEKAWESVKTFSKVLLLFGVWVLAYSIVWLPIVLVVKMIMKKLKK